MTWILSSPDTIHVTGSHIRLTWNNGLRETPGPDEIIVDVKTLLQFEVAYQKAKAALMQAALTPTDPRSLLVEEVK